MSDGPREQRMTANLDYEHRLAIALSKYYVDYKTIENYLRHLVRRGLLSKETAYNVHKRCVEHYLKLGLDEFQKAVRTPANYAAPFNMDIDEGEYNLREFSVEARPRPPRGIFHSVKEPRIPNIFEGIEVDMTWLDVLREATLVVLRWEREDKKLRGALNR